MYILMYIYRLYTYIYIYTYSIGIFTCNPYLQTAADFIRVFLIYSSTISTHTLATAR